LGNRGSHDYFVAALILSADFRFLAGAPRNGGDGGKPVVVLVFVSSLSEYLSIRTIRYRSGARLYCRLLVVAACQRNREIVKVIMYRSSILLAVLFLAASPASAQDQALIDAGAALYEMHCSGCHGARLRNTGTTFDLRELTEGERARFDIGVMDGKNMMPPWRGTVTDENLDQLWAYIRAYAYE
jgi:mono/diheme cytochrome c family protein